MKILLINSHHFIKGGADRVYFNTSELLISKGHEVYHFSCNNDKNEYSEQSNYFVRSRDLRKSNILKKVLSVPRFLYNKESKVKLDKIINDIKPDIAHLHLFYGGLSTSILSVLKKHKIPTVLTVHDYRLLCPSYLFIDGKNKICEKCKDGHFYRSIRKKCSGGNIFYSIVLSMEAYIRKIFFNPLKYIDEFIFVSKFIREKHIEFNNNYRNRSKHLYNFIPENFTNREEQNPEKYFLYYGRISREKGIKTLLQSVNNTTIKLKIVGTGEYLETIQSEISQNVEMIGYKSGTELWEIINKAYMVVIPSEWYENNPMTIIEAFILGKPVIGAKIGGIPELITEGYNGYLFESGNKENLKEILIKSMQIDYDLYHKMSKNAKEFATNNFNSEKHYRELLDIYQKNIKKGKK